MLDNIVLKVKKWKFRELLWDNVIWFGDGIWGEKGYGDINMNTDAQLKVINHIHAIVYIIELRNNFSIMWYYFLSWNMNRNTNSFIFINTESEHINDVASMASVFKSDLYIYSHGTFW